MNEINDNTIKEIAKSINNIDHLPPNIINQARKLANSRKGREVIQELSNKGIDKETVSKMIQEQKPIIPQINILIIRHNGILKNKIVEQFENNPPILQGINIKNMICNELSIGPLHDHIITLWYDANNKCKNKRINKIINVDIGGMVIITSSKKIFIQDFLIVEKLLHNKNLKRHVL
jgi:hypothetical protein